MRIAGSLTDTTEQAIARSEDDVPVGATAG